MPGVLVVKLLGGNYPAIMNYKNKEIAQVVWI